MPSSVRQRIVPILLLISTAGCALESSDGGTDNTSVCPPIVAYTAAQQIRLADDLRSVPADSMIVRFLNDYATERDQLRACQPKRISP